MSQFLHSHIMHLSAPSHQQEDIFDKVKQTVHILTLV
jgi:hypothetical protein